MQDLNYDGLGITIENYVAVVEIQRGPNNFFDTQMIRDLGRCLRQVRGQR
jgi:enoyl-CoA hydratase/carnithine racemase